MKKKRSILLIYTGGTIGMVKNPKTGKLAPFNFKQVKKEVPELNRFNLNIETYSFSPPLDSSNINPGTWIKLAEIIEERYQKFDGFVVLHGTDTMSYSASALGFMFENLTKPIIFTGSQLPIGTLRTDGKENLISAIEIASTYVNDKPAVPEVSIYFEFKCYRGNRTTKFSSHHFKAFSSANYPVLAESGLHIKYNYSAIHQPNHQLPIKIYKNLCCDVGVLKVFPGMQPQYVRSILNTKGIKAIVLETFGTGNAVNEPWFNNMLMESSQKGLIFLNVTQCIKGSVQTGLYETSSGLERAGVINGKDITFEAAITKIMHVLGTYKNIDEIKILLNRSLRGEITLV